MPGNFRRNRSKKLRRVSQLRFRAVPIWYEEGYDLHPKPSLINHLDRVQHVLKNTAQLSVVTIRHRLEVDFVVIGPGFEVVQDIGGGISIRHEGRFETCCSCMPEDLNRSFGCDQRLVVGAGHHQGVKPNTL